MPICKPQALGWQTGPPRGMDICNMAKLNQDLSIFTKSDKFGQDLQNKKWPDNLKRQLEDSISEDELPNIVHKLINKTEETFQTLVDGNEKINGNPFKNNPKKKEVRFSENNEISDGEIINETEKVLRIMEERDKNLKETYHINFLDRPLKNQEEPYGWELENPEFIQKPPNEDEETEPSLENEYSYLYLPYINFEELYGNEDQEILCEDKYLCHLPGAELNKIKFLELLTEEGIKGNLSN
ncbi:hypothetical protein O181_100634 [Austropuccinia psidii MF-1]|uniref:Uncharacterized protein n=1 Tax=Austropuccinia psidii MF-1 TaxID=1389203 RepID=A0A9Q3JFL0_9BASI|nr:hypothetical protein [Austropuccinia psidii MF-1]